MKVRGGDRKDSKTVVLTVGLLFGKMVYHIKSFFKLIRKRNLKNP